MTSKIRKTKLARRAQAALRLVKEFSRDICGFLRNDASNTPTPDCLHRPEVVRPCYVCRSRLVLSSDSSKGGK